MEQQRSTASPRKELSAWIPPWWTTLSLSIPTTSCRTKTTPEAHPPRPMTPLPLRLVLRITVTLIAMVWLGIVIVQMGRGMVVIVLLVVLISLPIDARNSRRKRYTVNWQKRVMVTIKFM